MANMDKVVKPERWENKDDRDLIEKEIGNIIKSHQEENKINFVINSLLTKCFDEKNNFYYSQEAESGYKSDLENSLKKEFGIKTWERKSNRAEILSTAFSDFVKQLKLRKRIKIKRIDDKVIEFLSDHDLLQPNASDNLFHPSDIEKFKSITIIDENDNEFVGLGKPDVGSIKNPMAMRALHQLKRLINTLIVEGQIDEHTKINIELSRQLNDANKRKAIEKWQNDRKELFKIYAEKIKELYPKENNGRTLGNLTDSDIEKFGYILEQRKDGKIVTKEDVLKYNLWKEQNHICIYTGKTINLSSFLGVNPEFDIEHTLPRSRSWDNSQKNKTLCENKFNRETKGNKTPFELQMEKDILPRIHHWKDRYESLYKDIQKLKGQSRNASDKEQKDNLIQKRHYLQMEHDYWKGKYERFTMEQIKEGFKNSQSVDIGIISKYARAYLKSVFNKVYSVKGEMVSEYRKAWGVNITTQDENGKEIKDRSNHIHHCIDAVTIACMDKNKYDKLAHAWGLEDKGEYEKAKKELTAEKPWSIFTQDVRNLKNDVLIVHHNKNVLPIQTKKKFRKRGKIQYRIVDNLSDDFKNKKEGKDYFIIGSNGTTTYRVPIFLQGDTVRGSLHQATFYGAIAKGKDGMIQKDNKDKVIPSYVVRKELKNLKKTDVANIVDDGIRAIIEQADKDKLITFNNNGAKVVEAGIWQNKKKQIPLKKVRIYTSVKSPLQDFKQHATPFLSKHDYKQQFNVVNDENYCMAIYEGENEKGKTERAYELINNIEAGEYYKLKNRKDRKLNNITLIPEKHIETGYSQKRFNGKPVILLKGLKVLLLNDENEDFNFNDESLIKSRLYTITGLDKDGIKVMYHQEGRSNSDSIAYMNEVINAQKLFEVKEDLEMLDKWAVVFDKFKDDSIKIADVFKEINQILNNHYENDNVLDDKGKVKNSKIKVSSLTTPKGGDVINRYEEFPYVKFKVSNFNALIEHIDFKISTTGKIQKL